MKLYNKGGRALILPKDEVISGGRIQANDIKKDRVYFDPEAEIELKDAYGEKVLGMYPKEIKRLDRASSNSSEKPKKTKAKKTVKKTKKSKKG